ncbi:hypothetical protein BV133_69 [Blastochloris viridis]|uniref:Uncharacterized protein n=1 Tax=Blastochloris viridis TaxID=1079 RepID=A0A182DUV0_BLAVI|nr:hypothetical protein BV133_69 [Blastochloris viridis]
MVCAGQDLMQTAVIQIALIQTVRATARLHRQSPRKPS